MFPCYCQGAHVPGQVLDVDSDLNNYMYTGMSLPALALTSTTVAIETKAGLIRQVTGHSGSHCPAIE